MRFYSLLHGGNTLPGLGLGDGDSEGVALGPVDKALGGGAMRLGTIKPNKNGLSKVHVRARARTHTRTGAKHTSAFPRADTHTDTPARTPADPEGVGVVVGEVPGVGPEGTAVGGGGGVRCKSRNRTDPFSVFLC